MGDILKRLVESAPKYKHKPDDGVIWDETFVRAIDSTFDATKDFVGLAHCLAGAKYSEGLDRTAGWFGQIMSRYHLPRGFAGAFSDADFELFKYHGHELFCSLICKLMYFDRWGEIERIFKTPIYVDNYYGGDSGNVGVGEISDHVQTLDERSRRLKENKISPHGQFEISRVVRIPIEAQEYCDADMLIYFRDRNWRPWTMPYLARIPKFLKQAEHKAFATQLAGVLGVDSIASLRTLVYERLEHLTKMFRHGWRTLTPLKIEDIGSK